MTDWEIFWEFGILYDLQFDGLRWNKKEIRPKELSLIEAIEIFGKDEVRQICTEKMAANEHFYIFQKFYKLLADNEINNQMEWELKIRRAKEADMETIAESLGFGPPRQRFIRSIRNPDEKTASLCLYPDGRGWYDFSMNEGGDSIDFVMKATKRNFREAVEFLQYF